MSRQRVGLLLALALFSAPFAVRSLQAAPGGGNAKEHVDKGAREYNLGHYQDALKAFEEAFRIDPAPVLLYNIAQCYRHLGDHERAISLYRRYLEHVPEALNRADIEARIRDIERTIAEKRTRDKPTPPAPTDAGKGPTDPPPLRTQPPAKHTAGPEIPAAGDSGTGGEAATGQSGSWKRIGAWGTGGAAIAALAVGLGFQLKASGTVSDFDASCGRTPDGAPVSRPTGTMSDEQCGRLFDDWQSARRLSIAGYATGAVLGAASAILFYLSRPETAADEGGVLGNRAVACAPGFGASVVCRVAF